MTSKPSLVTYLTPASIHSQREPANSDDFTNSLFVPPTSDEAPKQPDAPPADIYSITSLDARRLVLRLRDIEDCVKSLETRTCKLKEMLDLVQPRVEKIVDPENMRSLIELCVESAIKKASESWDLLLLPKIIQKLIPHEPVKKSMHEYMDEIYQLTSISSTCMEEEKVVKKKKKNRKR